MAFTPKPRLNDVIKAAPVGTKFTISVNNPQGLGRAINGKYGISYVFDVIYNRAEYVYFVNSDNHKADIEKFTKSGTKTVVIEAVDYYNEETGKSVIMYNTTPSDVQQSSNPTIAVPGASIKAPIDPVRAFDDTIEAYRHEYALEVFRGLIREKQPLELTDKIKTILCMWSRYSAGLDPVTFPTSKEEPVRNNTEPSYLEDEMVETISF